MKVWLVVLRYLHSACWVAGIGISIGISIEVCAAEPHTASSNARIVRWAHVYEASHPLHKWAVWASERFYEETNGRYKILVYPSSLLGKEGHLNQSLSLGTVDIIYTGISFAAQTHPPLGLSELPYIFNDISHWQRFFKSSIFLDMSEDYSELASGNRIASVTYYGTRHMTANRQINTPEDIQGLKIRVPGAKVYHIFPLSLGAKPSPIAFSEVYLALQQGVVDAQENPLPTISAKKLYEVQTHINLTGHILGSILTITNSRFLNELSKKDQGVLLGLLEEASTRASRDIELEELQLKRWFIDNGVVVHTLDTQPFKRATQRYLSDRLQPKSQGIYDNIQSL
ncbi:sialic acid TRAP transporter substrate-binding protein SiaP [Alteromonas macleodii]|uniref:Tripartite ATP-independent transporter solute receptor, DctP family n=1 Tax=Alteromonas macleodii TaxID=28108 RepID=A0A6T9XZ11_ALTMA|nr:sialic acid TRAP transporter substrate-binding protein SiaP [Alteromonas macleodii]CAB9493668.1 Tripartite ATP-independent transporter solute receptor, DctP family [Alteromonas macleodii]